VVTPRWLNDIEFRAWIGYRRMRLLLDAEVARDLTRTSGLSTPDYDVLSALADAKDRRQRLTTLAARMLWSKSRLSRHISRMELRGLVVRVEDAADGRRADVVLTEKGRHAIVEAAGDHVESVRRHFIDLLTEDQLRIFGDIAEAVLTRLPQFEADDAETT
jgi:DNA-binding MarR family transcriptional regulator